jgi:hypothetical protein
MKIDKNNELSELIESYKRLTKFVILTFDQSNLDTKNQILRNFIAKVHSLINSISILLKEEQEGEAMALYRLLIERYFYLEYLHKTDSYQAFKDWSFIKTFDVRNKMRSNSEFNNPKTKEYLVDSKEQVKKYQSLKNKKNKWIEPKMENFAKEINLSFLYSLGYDLGSSFIHPRADEGYWDALRIVKDERIVEFKKNNIITNSMLLANGILISATNRSDFEFGKHLNFYCNSIFEYLGEDKELPDLESIEKKIMRI